MGLILDSSVLITAEREGQNARQMLAAISSKAGNTESQSADAILLAGHMPHGPKPGRQGQMTVLKDRTPQ
jgi:hypothetical protein